MIDDVSWVSLKVAPLFIEMDTSWLSHLVEFSAVPSKPS
jgi:hypothetical protein